MRSIWHRFCCRGQGRTILKRGYLFGGRRAGQRACQGLFLYRISGRGWRAAPGEGDGPGVVVLPVWSGGGMRRWPSSRGCEPSPPAPLPLMRERGGRRRSRLCVRSVSAGGRQTTCLHPGLFPAGAGEGHGPIWGARVFPSTASAGEGGAQRRVRVAAVAWWYCGCGAAAECGDGRRVEAASPHPRPLSR